MPVKKGGFGQLHNVQVLAGKHQVIYAIATHDNPDDTAASHPLLTGFVTLRMLYLIFIRLAAIPLT